MIDVNGNRFMTLLEAIYVDGKRVNQVFVNGVQVYPCLAEKIGIVVPPSKTVYSLNESIDYTGIQVQAQNPDGSPWENPRYPRGMIPFEELIFSPYQTAADVQVPLDMSGFPYYLDYPEPFYTAKHVQVIYKKYLDLYGHLMNTVTYEIYGDNILVYRCNNDGRILITMLCASKDPGTMRIVRTVDATWYTDEPGGTRTEEYDLIRYSYHGDYPHTYSFYGYTTYFYTTGNQYTCYIQTPKFTKSVSIDDDYPPVYMWWILYGNCAWGEGYGRNKMKIPVKWLRPEDGKEMTAYFDINVST
jgi:hypothetical protein